MVEYTTLTFLSLPVTSLLQKGDDLGGESGVEINEVVERCPRLLLLDRLDLIPDLGELVA